MTRTTSRRHTLFAALCLLLFQVTAAADTSLTTSSSTNTDSSNQETITTTVTTTVTTTTTIITRTAAAPGPVQVVPTPLVQLTAVPSAAPVTAAPVSSAPVSAPPTAWPTTAVEADPSTPPPPVRIDEPALWTVILYGNNCTSVVADDLDFIADEILMVLQAHIPELVYIPPSEDPVEGDGGRNLRGDSESSRNLLNLCPTRKQCKTNAYKGWCRTLGCYWFGDRRSLRELQESNVPIDLEPEPETSTRIVLGKHYLSWNNVALDTWSDYTKQQADLANFVVDNKLNTTGTDGPIVHNYIDAVQDMNFVLYSFVQPLTDFDQTNATDTCFLGAKLQAL